MSNTLREFQYTVCRAYDSPSSTKDLSAKISTEDIVIKHCIYKSNNKKGNNQ